MPRPTRPEPSPRLNRPTPTRTSWSTGRSLRTFYSAGDGRTYTTRTLVSYTRAERERRPLVAAAAAGAMQHHRDCDCEPSISGTAAVAASFLQPTRPESCLPPPAAMRRSSRASSRRTRLSCMGRVVLSQCSVLLDQARRRVTNETEMFHSPTDARVSETENKIKPNNLDSS